MGLGFSVAGFIAFAAILAVDVFRAGNFDGIGPMQQMALLGAGIIFLVGLTLIPFGNRPA